MYKKKIRTYFAPLAQQKQEIGLLFYTLTDMK